MYKHSHYNGHSAAELLVSPRYKGLKEEILGSGFVTFEQWKTNVAFKAREYLAAEKVKAIKSKGIDWGDGNKKHDVEEETPISFNHLCCVILYCDITALCTEFSGTFRRKNAFEKLPALKKRHARYANFAKGLIEAVNDFGTGYEPGPFF
eukprot:397135_1